MENSHKRCGVFFFRILTVYINVAKKEIPFFVKKDIIKDKKRPILIKNLQMKAGGKNVGSE